MVADFHGSFHGLLVEFLAVPVCAFVLLAMVCPAAIDLANVVGHSGCFAAIAFSMTDSWPSLVSLADALLPLSLASLG